MTSLGKPLTTFSMYGSPNLLDFFRRISVLALIWVLIYAGCVILSLICSLTDIYITAILCSVMILLIAFCLAAVASLTLCIGIGRRMPVKENGVLLPLRIAHTSVEKRAPVNTRSAIWAGMLFIEVFIYSSYSILINLSKVRGHIPYSSAAVVLLIEAAKLTFSFAMYLPEFIASNYAIPTIPLIMYLQFSVPALLYTINNNIAIHMQVHMDPTTYQVLCNMKIAMTAILYRIVMKRDLTSRKWAALGLLVLAGTSDSYSGFHHKVVTGSNQIYITMTGLLMMLLYCTISSFAAVYSEYLMKKQLKMSIHVQNMMFYSYGIVLNGGAWLLQQSRNDAPAVGFLTGFSTFTWLLVLSQAANGLIMSVLMKHGSNITRLFLIASSMLTSTVLSVIILGTQLNLMFMFGALLVLFAFVLYYY